MSTTTPPSLIDSFGREIDYLRLSVTDRCDFRCTYCMAEDMTFLPRKEVLSIEELERVAQIFVTLGVAKIRITGGEPLIRRGVDQLLMTLKICRALGSSHSLPTAVNSSKELKCCVMLALTV